MTAPSNLSRAGAGRPKGRPNKTTAMLREAILRAGEKAGGKDGLEGWLVDLAKNQPVAYATLLGKILPLNLAGDDDGGTLRITRIELVAPAG
jgi:hypothetical protein